MPNTCNNGDVSQRWKIGLLLDFFYSIGLFHIIIENDRRSRRMTSSLSNVDKIERQCCDFASWVNLSSEYFFFTLMNNYHTSAATTFSENPRKRQWCKRRTIYLQPPIMTYTIAHASFYVYNVNGIRILAHWIRMMTQIWLFKKKWKMKTIFVTWTKFSSKKTQIFCIDMLKMETISRIKAVLKHKWYFVHSTVGIRI